MAAIDPGFYYKALYGGIPLVIVSLEFEGGRDIAIQSPSRGDKHVNQDRGLAHKVAQVEIVFIDQPGIDSFTDRYADFVSLAEGTQSQLFSNPLIGSYQARIGQLRTSSSSDTREIRCSCTIIPEDEPTTVFPIGAGVAPAAGPDAVSTAQLTADAALSSLGLSTPVTAACTATVTGWSTTDTLDSQAVFGGVATLTQQISDAIDELDLQNDLERWSAFQAMVNLAFQVSRAGEAFTSTSGSTFEITVSTPQPLLAICATIYGAARASDFADQVQQLNRVRTPGLVPKGTILKMPPVPS